MPRQRKPRCLFCSEVLETEIEMMAHSCPESRPFEFLIGRIVYGAIARAMPAAAPGAKQKTQAEVDLENKLRQAAEFVSSYSGIPVDQILRYKASFDEAFRAAKIRLHPDHPERGGNTQLFQQLGQLAEMLKKYVHR